MNRSSLRKSSLLLGGGVLTPMALFLNHALPPSRESALVRALTSSLQEPITSEMLLTQRTVSFDEIDKTLDRVRVLRAVFTTVAKGNADQERVESFVRYLQGRVFHPKWPPLHPDGVMVMDPIWILKNRLGQCGQTNRVLVDALIAAGYQARVVQLAAHVAAEGYWDGKWHFLDADWLSNGQFVRESNGTIPSAMEIHAHPEYLFQLKPNSEFDSYPVNIFHSTYQPYPDMFKHVTFGNSYTTPYYIVKNSERPDKSDPFFGWLKYSVEVK